MKSGKMNSSNTSNRIAWIDYAKGIAILLVIVGHTIRNFYIRSIIFSFHMPIFFILSGYTFRPSKNIKDFLRKTKNSFKGLIIPAYCIWIIRLILYYAVNHIKYSASEIFYSALYASGVQINTNGIAIPAFGMIWFLVVLFWIRVLYDIIHLLIRNEKIRIIVIFIISELGIIIGKKQFLYFSFDIALAVLIIFFTGYIINTKKILISGKWLSDKIIFVSFFIWTGLLGLCFIHHTHFEIASRDYPFNFSSIIMAIAGSLVFISVCIWLSSLKGFFDPITQLISTVGRFSLIMFAVHAFDNVWYPYIRVIPNIILVLFLRLGIDLILFFLTLKVLKKH